MIGKDDIDEFYSHVESLRLRFPVADLAKATGYAKGNVSDFLRKTKPVSEKFMKAVYEKFPKSNKMVPRENADNKDESGYDTSNIKNLPGDEITKQILLNLSDSHKSLAAAHADIAASNRILMEKEQSTVDAGSESFLAFGRKLEALLEAVIAVGTGKKWTSAAEARAELNRTVREKQELVK